MNFTFGIITSKESNQWVPQMIESIKKQNIPNYEIIIVGESGVEDDAHIKNIPFDESIKAKWITKKKNLITQNAKYDNIVYTHDYHIFDDNWYQGYLAHGDDFKVCLNVIYNNDGSRYRDWTWWDWNSLMLPNCEHLLPYNETRCSRWMYVNGSYWVAKKHVMEEYPLDENLVHMQQEDVAWSKEVTKSYNFTFNINSSIRMLKYHDAYWKIMTDSTYHNILQPFLRAHGL